MDTLAVQSKIVLQTMSLITRGIRRLVTLGLKSCRLSSSFTLEEMDNALCCPFEMAYTLDGVDLNLTISG
jgi:hypothetical protein